MARATTAPARLSQDWFLPGPMGQEIEAFDWASVGLPLQDWPVALRHALSLILRSPLPMLVIWGPMRRLIYNAGYAEMLGPRHPQAMGRPFLDVWPEIGLAGGESLEAAFNGVSSQYQEALLREEQAGRVVERYFSFWLTPIVGSDDRVGGVLCGGSDVTEKVRQQRALSERDAHLTLALAAGQIAPWIVDYRTKRVTTSVELNRMLGLPDEAGPNLEELTAAYMPGELERIQAAFAETVAQGGSHFETEYRHIRADNGAVRWLLLRSYIERSEDNQPQRTIGVVMDITDRKEAEERLRLLAREVDHRANNLLTVVQGLVQLEGNKDVAAFRASLMGRIWALGNAHRLLSESRWTGASLKGLIGEELAPYLEGDRVQVTETTDDVLLSPRVAQSVAMVLHELATNASKYGALSVPKGSVHLSCARCASDRMELIWAETGGPAVHTPTRTGVGLTVIRRAIASLDGAAVHLEWLPGGLRCDIQFPA